VHGDCLVNDVLGDFMTDKHYAERDHLKQGDYFINHVSAMTAEGLHRKSAIAGELAHRDIRIDEAYGVIEDESLFLRKLHRDESIPGHVKVAIFDRINLVETFLKEVVFNEK